MIVSFFTREGSLKVKPYPGCCKVMRLKHYATILNQPREASTVFDNQILSKDKIIKVFLNQKILYF